MEALKVFRPVRLSRRLFMTGGALALTGIGIRSTQANAVIGKAVEIISEPLYSHEQFDVVMM